MGKVYPDCRKLKSPANRSIFQILAQSRILGGPYRKASFKKGIRVSKWSTWGNFERQLWPTWEEQQKADKEVSTAARAEFDLVNGKLIPSTNIAEALKIKNHNPISCAVARVDEP